MAAAAAAMAAILATVAVATVATAVVATAATAAAIDTGDVEIDDRTNRLAFLHRLEAFVDVFELDAIRNPVVQMQAPLHIELDEARHIDAEPVGAHG